MTGEAVEGYTNKETWAVGLFLNNTQEYQQLAHTALRAIDWDVAMAGKVVLVDAGAFERVRANIAGEILHNLVEDLLAPTVMGSDLYAALRDIGSIWRVDWDQLGAEFLHDLTEIED